MRIDELLQTSRTIMLEYGRKGFPGYGMGLFSQRFYQYMVPKISQISDQHAKDWLTHWLCDVFSHDNSKFKADLFQRAVAANKQYSAAPAFQQRHFFYLAHCVKEIDDPHIHDFVQNWLAEVAGRTNPNFKSRVWAQYCAQETPVKPAAAAPPPDSADPSIQPVDEGPAFGERGHGGFGKKFFTAGHYRFIAAKLSHVSDATVKRHLINWWSKLFTLDNPAFKPEAFAKVASAYSMAPNVRWQQRHFYFVAHEIAETADPHERKFLCDWFAENVGRTNEYFQIRRWEEYCHLDAESYDRKAVQHSRAKATGAAEVPEHPSVAQHAAWLAKHPEYARQEPADDDAA